MSGEDLRKWWWLAMAAVLGALLYALGPILTPFAVSLLLAWLGDPLVGRLQRRGMGRTLAVVLVFALMTLALLLALLVVVPLLERQIAYLVQQLPAYGAWLRDTALPWIEQRTGLELAGYFDPARLIGLLKQHWHEAGGIASAVLGGISRSGLAILGWLASLLLIPVLTFYFLRDWPGMVERVRELLPRPLEPTVVRLAAESDAVLGGFLRGQLSVMLALGAIYSLGLWLVGIELAFLIGMLAGLVSFVPYLGAFIGVAAGLVAALVQHGDLLHVVLVLVVFGVGQALESFLLTPWLVGDRIGLHPVAVIFAIMAGGQLFGFLGVLLALPVAAVAMVVLRWLHARYTESDLYGAPAVPPLVAHTGEPLAPAGDSMPKRDA
ncbi:AI-2E family transporter [Rehaibacterium terrae]|jgi:predicted PurR-regulated permease PerM|uniref:Putative PurR-regulated permease PerM n=1 Tax=Rehaibacterium terrae TaxID=1341696 RepID=A0A7W7V7D8_9GAMM|nr:AI-2E family transporter [Rehaibacterium terrae]MBB5014605.1 putative PurR-regulated permease PerM [Rehaibacterium terrae]